MNARFLAIARDPSIIPGVHHFCDEWCDYCPVAGRCLEFRCTEVFRRQRGRREADSTFTSMDEAIAFTREVAAIDGSSTEELDAILANAPGESGLTTADPLASVAWEYAVDAAFFLLPQTNEILSRRPQPSGPSAGDVVLWYHLRIYMRVVRALVSRDRACGADRLVEDANGCAKLVLVSVERSRAALLSMRSAENGGKIDLLVARLDELEHGIAERFPQARGFVRVGLDCPAAPACEV
jgi:hypothetical protein